MTTPLLTTAGIRSLDTYAGTFVNWLKTMILHLYKNNHVPVVTDVVGSYTEADFDGYGAVNLTSWGTPSLDGNNNDLFTNPDVVFNMTGAITPNTVYGYYWTDGAGVLMAAQDNGGGFPMSGAGYSYTVSPRFYFGQILPPL